MAPTRDQIYNDAIQSFGDEALAKEFADATQEVSQFTSASNEDKLKFYSLFKQATQSSSFNPNGRPSSLWNFEAGPKWDAWKAVVDKGTTPAEAARQYIALVKEFKAKHATT